MKELNPKQTEGIGGGRDAPQYDTELAPEPVDTDVVTDYNPPPQPQ